MAMTVVITRDVADRYRGFLASLMPEVAPGVYVSPNLSPAVRNRMWGVLSQWWRARPGGSILAVWREADAPGGLGLTSLGVPVRRLADLDGVLTGRH